MAEAKERIEWVDLASGIMILWLLVFHALFPSVGANITGKIPFLYFFMPWFFFKSGMLFKVKDPQIEFKTNFRKLIINGFIVWSIIGHLAYLLDHWLIYHDLTLRLAFYTPARCLLLKGSIPINEALWFLPVLFLVRQAFNFIKFKIHPPYGYYLPQDLSFPAYVTLQIPHICHHTYIALDGDYVALLPVTGFHILS